MSSKTKFLLLISFCVNAVLLAGWLVSRSNSQAIIKNTTESKATTFATPSKNSRASRSIQTVTVDREKPLDWTSLESEDYREYITRLRAIGCPEETVRDIIISDINKLYASKIAGLYPSPKDLKFWRVEDRVARNEERDRDKKRHELEQEKRALIKELLGVDYDAELARLSGRPNDDDMRYGFLSPEKQEQAKALREKYRDMEQSLFNDGGMTPENRAKFMALRAERESEMAKLLGPEEFEQYQLRSSRTARSMRENLSGFQPSEEEFRQIFQARKTFDDQYAFSRDGGDESVRDERKLAQQKLDEQLKSVLGEERFRDYQMSQDDRFRDSFDFAQKYNLPREKAQTIYEVRVAVEQERQRIQNDANLSAAARAAALQEVSQSTQTALGQALGKEVFDKYSSRNGGWITQDPANGNSSGRRNRDSRRDRGPRNAP